MIMPTKDRYSCQVSLPGFGKAAQAKLQNAKVLMVGVGGLGCPTAQYLVGAGIGTLAIADFDKVSLSNLHRQILFNEHDVGQLKTVAAKAALTRQNPQVRIIPLAMRITYENVMDIIEPYDIVVDCTDNFEIRYTLNDACVLSNKPLVYGAAYQYEGQVAVWNLPNSDGTRSPHYRDIFPFSDASTGVDCTSGGVIPTLTGIIGCMEANEVIKYLTGKTKSLASQLLIFNALTMQCHTIALPHASRMVIKDLPHSVPELSVADLRLSISSHLYQLVDVRTSAEHKEFNIGGSSLPLDELKVSLAKLDTGKPTVFYCASGLRSSAAVRYILENHPEINALSLKGGMKAWREQ